MIAIRNIVQTEEGYSFQLYGNRTEGGYGLGGATSGEEEPATWLETHQAEAQAAVDAGYKIFIQYEYDDGGNVTDAVLIRLDDNLERAKRQMRKERRRLWWETDWSQLNDAPLEDAEYEAWANYRQALIDLGGIPDPYTATFPERPHLPVFGSQPNNTAKGAKQWYIDNPAVRTRFKDTILNIETYINGLDFTTGAGQTALKKLLTALVVNDRFFARQILKD